MKKKLICTTALMWVPKTFPDDVLVWYSAEEICWKQVFVLDGSEYQKLLTKCKKPPCPWWEKIERVIATEEQGCSITRASNFWIKTKTYAQVFGELKYITPEPKYCIQQFAEKYNEIDFSIRIISFYKSVHSWMQLKWYGKYPSICSSRQYYISII